MIDGGFNFDNEKDRGSKSSGLRSYLKNGARKGLNGAGKGVKSGFSRLFKSTAKTVGGFRVSLIKIYAFLALILFGFIFMFLLVYYTSDEDDGKKGNYVTKSNETSVPDADGNVEIEDYSPENAACLAYYTVLSKENSVWQLQSDGTLIKAGDEGAKQDYFKNDKEFFINPNLLYSMNKYLLEGQTGFVFPECFLQPVARDKNGDLQDLCDKDGYLQVLSHMKDKYGKSLDEANVSVSDYGIASVLSYEDKTLEKHLKGSYDKEDYIKEDGTIGQRNITPVEFDTVISSEVQPVLTKAVTFAGTITYTYREASIKTGDLAGGATDDNEANRRKILYDTVTQHMYVAYPNFGYDTARRGVYSEDLSYLEDYCSTHNYYISRGADGEPATVERVYKLYRYRSDDSGFYTNFVEIDNVDTKKSERVYLQDYLTNFSTYKPVVDRSMETFKKFTSKSTESMYKSAANGESGASGGGGELDTVLYDDGPAHEALLTIWDSAIAWGFTEPQAAAICAHFWGETRLNKDSVNEIGATGLGQWLGSRLDGLTQFSSSYNSADKFDLTSQVQYALMELIDADYGAYKVENQWAFAKAAHYDKYVNDWYNSEDPYNTCIAIALCVGRHMLPREFEANDYSRTGGDAGRQNDLKRFNAARTIYDFLKGRSPELDVPYIAPNGTVDGAGASGNMKETARMSEKDRNLFYNFYHAVDGVYDGNFAVSYFTHPLTSEEAEKIILFANTFINRSSLSEERLNSTDEMWNTDFLSDLSEKQEKSLSSMIDAEPASLDEIKEFNFIFGADLKGFHSLNSYFGHRNVSVGSHNHAGDDFSCDGGTEVYASESGVVTQNRCAGARGWYVVISHGTTPTGKEVATGYQHLRQKAHVSIGEHVKQGQCIGYVGGTGSNGAVVYGNHLHEELYINGIPYNPVYMFNIDYKKETVTMTALRNGRPDKMVLSKPGGTITCDEVRAFPDLYKNIYMINRDLGVYMTVQGEATYGP